jgi:hypothetical protein
LLWSDRGPCRGPVPKGFQKRAPRANKCSN